MVQGYENLKGHNIRQSLIKIWSHLKARWVTNLINKILWEKQQVQQSQCWSLLWILSILELTIVRKVHLLYGPFRFHEQISDTNNYLAKAGTYQAPEAFTVPVDLLTNC